jgi:CDP-diglyceride synthetase
MLDRLDSVLFMAVLMYCYLLFFRTPMMTPVG